MLFLGIELNFHQFYISLLKYHLSTLLKVNLKLLQIPTVINGKIMKPMLPNRASFTTPYEHKTDLWFAEVFNYQLPRCTHVHLSLSMCLVEATE